MESKFEYKTLCTWVKLTKNGKLFYGTGHHFRGATEHLIVLRRPKLKALRTNLRNIHIEKAGLRTVKPISFEKEIIDNIGGKWAYIFSGEKNMPKVHMVDIHVTS